MFDSGPGSPLPRSSLRIAVVGGGPAGCFFALHALKLARERGIELELTLFEPKDFSARGPRGCNKCAGILSSRLIRGLHELGLSLPSAVVLGEIHGYVLHLTQGVFEITRPQPQRQILSVYRGSGPRLGALGPEISFDAWLLNQAEQAGVHVVRESVEEVSLQGSPRLQTHARSYTSDLVVLATGVNARPPRLNPPHYIPPPTEIMAQDELLAPAFSDGGRVHVHFGQPGSLVFACLVAKGPYVNVSLLGHHLEKDAVGALLQEADVHSTLHGEPQRLCGCRPRVAVDVARGYYADHFVAVGDAAVTRLYKDGIGSAFLTAQQAARTVLEMGIHARDFARGYAPLCHAIARDNRIGRLLFALWEYSRRSPRLTEAWLRVLQAELSLSPEARGAHLALWGMFTGDDSYGTILRRLLSVPVGWRWACHALGRRWAPDTAGEVEP